MRAGSESLPGGLSGRIPPRPPALSRTPDRERRWPVRIDPAAVGQNGVLTTGTYGDGSRIVTPGLKDDYTKPDPTIPRAPEGGGSDERHKKDWINGIKTGTQPTSNFAYSGPFTEWVVMGNLCLRFKGKLQWDGKNMQFTNRPEANNFVHYDYRRR